MDCPKLQRAADTPEGRNAFQRKFNRLEKWAANPSAVQQKQMQRLERTDPRQQYWLGTACLGSHAAEMGMGSRWTRRA